MVLTANRPRYLDRAIVALVLGGVVVVAWLYLIALTAAMGDMSSRLAMPMSAQWTARDWLFMTTMWVVMMIGMMLPSAFPMITTYHQFTRGESVSGSTPVFTVGYLVTWTAFALVAAALQWALHNAALVTSMGVSASPVVGGVLLLAAGAFQFTPLKTAGLAECRTPMGFLMTEWRDGRKGALVMGMRHGVFCVSCCWALMVLLFVLGVMNLAWVAVLALIVIIEKVTPRPDIVTSVLGGLLMLWGAGLVVGAI
jgi:predicted metal-binding membrane protein